MVSVAHAPLRLDYFHVQLTVALCVCVCVFVCRYHHYHHHHHHQCCACLVEGISRPAIVNVPFVGQTSKMSFKSLVDQSECVSEQHAQDSSSCSKSCPQPLSLLFSQSRFGTRSTCFFDCYLVDALCAFVVVLVCACGTCVSCLYYNHGNPCRCW